MLKFSRVFIYASNKSLCGTLIISLGKNAICACYCKQIKTSFVRIKQEYKICISNLSMNNCIYLIAWVPKTRNKTVEILETNNR